MESLIVVAVIIVLVLLVLARSVRIVPQARAGIVERLGRYQRTLNAGLTILIPFVDRLKPLIDLREQVVSFRRSRSSRPTTWWSRSTPSSTSRSPTRAPRRTRSPTTSRASSSSRSHAA